MIPPGWEEAEEDEEWLDESENGLTGGGFEQNDDELFDDEEDFADGDDIQSDEEDELEELIDEGEALIEEGLYQEALETFREAAERYNESAEAIFHLGHTAMLLFSDGATGNPSWEEDDELTSLFEEALGAFDTALGLDGEYYPALNSQGTLHYAAGNVKAAFEAWELSLDIEPEQEDIAEVLEEARTQAAEE